MLAYMRHLFAEFIATECGKGGEGKQQNVHVRVLTLDYSFD